MKIFGWEHIVYLLVVAAVFIPALICAKKFAKSEKSQKIIIKTWGVILLLSILASRIVQLFIWEESHWHYIFPTSYCGLTSLVLSLAVIFGKKDNCVYHFIWLLTIIGGIASLMYPDFLAYNPTFFHPDTITAFLHHTFALIMIIILLMFKQINITYKKWYYTLFGFTCYLTYGAFLIGFFNYADAFCIMGPILSETPLTAWGMAPIYAVIYGTALLVIELVRKRKNKNVKTKE